MFLFQPHEVEFLQSRRPVSVYVPPQLQRALRMRLANGTRLDLAEFMKHEARPFMRLLSRPNRLAFMMPSLAGWWEVAAVTPRTNREWQELQQGVLLQYRTSPYHFVGFTLPE